MLIALTVTARSRADKSTGIFIFNTDFLTELRVSGTGSRFYYLARPEDKAGSREQITVAETVATIRTAINLAFVETAITLRVYPQEDLTQDTVYTTFLMPEIVMAWDAGASPLTNSNRTYLLINEKGNIKRYLIDHYYLDLLSYSLSESTSTYTTVTSS
jgi:hypothetical protein